MLSLLRELVRRGRLLECLTPTAGEPLEHAQLPKEDQPAALVAAFQRVRLQLFPDAAGSFDLAQTCQAACQHVSRAVVPLELQP